MLIKCLQTWIMVSLFTSKLKTWPMGPVLQKGSLFPNLLLSSTLHPPPCPQSSLQTAKLVKCSVISGCTFFWCYYFLFHLSACFGLDAPFSAIWGPRWIHWLSFYWDIYHFTDILIVFLLVSPKQDSPINKLEFQTTQYFYRGSMKVVDWFLYNAYWFAIYNALHCILFNNSTFAYSALFSFLQLFQLFYTLFKILIFQFPAYSKGMTILPKQREEKETFKWKIASTSSY